MNPKSTWVLVVIAALLFGAVLLERQVRKPDEEPRMVLPGIKASAVTSIQILPKDQTAIRVERTNGFWQLTEPVFYPAQRFRIEQLLAAFEGLVPSKIIGGAELRERASADQEFGFTPRQSVLVFHEGDAERRILIGNRTAPGTDVFVQVVGAEDVYVVDAEILKLLPVQLSDWRDPTLLGLQEVSFDRIAVTNAGIILDLRLNPTNRLWRIAQPVAHRADNEVVGAALQRLQLLRALSFEDSPPPLETIGLQPPDMTLALRQGTNTVVFLEFGRTNSAGQVYARRAGQSTVVTVARELVEPWMAAHSHYYRDYVDPQLVVFSGYPERIEVRAQDAFTLVRQGNNGWRLLPRDVPADTALVDQMLALLATMRVKIEEEVVTEAGLPSYGLDTPSRRYVLSIGSITNEIHFGTNKADRIYARCRGENFVHSVKAEEVQALPFAGWQLRDRRIWNFSENDVSNVVFQTSSATNEFSRRGAGNWAIVRGANTILGEVEMAAIEEITHRIGELSALAWVAHGETNDADYGFSPAGRRLIVRLRNDSEMIVEFGRVSPSGAPYARTVIANELWTYEFPWPLYYLMERFLRAPATIQ